MSAERPVTPSLLQHHPLHIPGLSLVTGSQSWLLIGQCHLVSGVPSWQLGLLCHSHISYLSDIIPGPPLVSQDRSRPLIGCHGSVWASDSTTLLVRISPTQHTFLIDHLGSSWMSNMRTWEVKTTIKKNVSPKELAGGNPLPKCFGFLINVYLTINIKATENWTCTTNEGSGIVNCCFAL